MLAAFSSRGPQIAVPDLPKPDVTAPGVNILAGNTPDPAPNTELPAGYLFQSISGTSMAGPHVAGAGALLKATHPTWSPAVIKSALPGDMYRVFTHYKRDEWERFLASVTEWDVKTYLDCLP